MSADTQGPAGHSDWPAVKALFDAASVLPSAEREAHLLAALVSTAVRDEVRSLLAHLDDTAWLQSPLPAAPPAVQAGDRFGAWQILRVLGSGGMGEVFEARRADGQFEGRAAIKLLKRGLDSRAVLDRFALERSALARLNHPHIARLFDAGQSEAGLPYFVMELVDGRPIDAVALELPLEARLSLFLQLADAVSHAHRQLLVHRDLKPGNVLVTVDGQVKLLDFGIAKALDPLEAGQALDITNAQARPFTPQYASPEQVRGEAVSTATDIYSLGVLLYVMLTGARPYGRSATTPHETARSVLEEEPSPPSSLAPDLVSDPQWLATRKRLRGDLDNILLKALDKRIEQRYPSVEALGADVRAFLAGFPVSAQAPSAGYRMQKFVARHRWSVAAGVVAVLALVGGSALALWQAQEAAAQRDEAQKRFSQARKLANQLVFKYHDQIAMLPGAAPVREALLLDAAGFLDELGRAAGNDLVLAEELADTYYRISQLQGVDPSVNLGQPAKAEAHLDKAIALSRGYLGRAGLPLPSLAHAIEMRVSRAELWQARGRLVEADQTIRDALPLLEQALSRSATDSWVLASAVSLRGVHARVLGNQMGHAHLGRWREACRSAELAIDAAEATLRADPKNKFGPDTLAFTLGEHGHCRLLAGELGAAADLFARQVALRDLMAVRMPDDIDFRYQRGNARAHLARVWSAEGRHGEALALMNEARAITRAALAGDAGNTAGQRRLDVFELLFAELYGNAGDRLASRHFAEEALRRFPAAQDMAYGQRRIRAEAAILASRGCLPAQPQKALAYAREAGELLVPMQAADGNVARMWLLAQAWTAQAQALLAGGQRHEAAAAAGQALQLWQVAQGGSIELPPPFQKMQSTAKSMAAASD